MKHLSRRSLITGLISFIAAPAIVRAASIMPVKVIDPRREMLDLLRRRVEHAEALIIEHMQTAIYSTEDMPMVFSGFDPFWSTYREVMQIGSEPPQNGFPFKTIAAGFGVEISDG